MTDLFERWKNQDFILKDVTEVLSALKREKASSSIHGKEYDCTNLL